MPLNSTRNDLDKDTRKKVVALLGARLADAIDMTSQAKQAHWNVKGPSFIALHELFDSIYGDLAGYVDLLAERAVQLGAIVEGTVRSAATASSLPEYPLRITAGDKHVAAMADALAAFGRHVRQAIGTADELGDADTADIFTEISRGVDKWLWMVEAHLQD